tara:strand:+ start:238 stop:591 length:354 start_codon:yes stop_codon:yes gene_type:complete
MQNILCEFGRNNLINYPIHIEIDTVREKELCKRNNTYLNYENVIDSKINELIPSSMLIDNGKNLFTIVWIQQFQENGDPYFIQKKGKHIIVTIDGNLHKISNNSSANLNSSGYTMLP